MSSKKILPASFFERNTTQVAKELIGCEILRKVNKYWIRVRIVETEAYLGEGDPASHSSRGPTPRSKVMFGPAGVLYVYFIYGNYFLLNFVTEKKGKAGAVLIRAVEPLDGIAHMAELRGINTKLLSQCDLYKITSGPAKLTMAMGINGTLNGKKLGLPHLGVQESSTKSVCELIETTRIGISAAQELPLRFYEKENPFVSKL